MPLSEAQKALLEDAAEREGVDPDELIAQAEAELEASPAGQPAAPARSSTSASSADPPKLFQYHLPFVTVKEVRQKWLGLTEAFVGDKEVAASWAAKFAGSPAAAAPGPGSDDDAGGE